MSFIRSHAVATWAATLALLVLALTSPHAAHAAHAAQPRGGAAKPAASVQQIRDLYRQRRYAEALGELSRALAARPADVPRKDKAAGKEPAKEPAKEPGEEVDEEAAEAARAADRERSELWFIKGEVHLRLKSADAAAAAFRKARESAEAGGDKDRAAASRAMILLLDRAKGAAYTPEAAGRLRGGGGGGGNGAQRSFDLSEPGQCRAAFRALFDAERRAAAPKLAAAGVATDPGPLGKALDALADLRALERAAGGDGRETAELAAPLAPAAAEILRVKLDQASGRVATLERRANSTLVETMIGNDPDDVDPREQRGRRRALPGFPRRAKLSLSTGDRAAMFEIRRFRGLTDGDHGELRGAAEACRRVSALAGTLAEALADAPPGGGDAADDAEGLGALAVEAGDVARRAEFLLGFDFSGTDVQKAGDPDWARRDAERRERRLRQERQGRPGRLTPRR